MSSSVSKYGMTRNDANYSLLDNSLLLEMDAIRRGGKWKDKAGNERGLGLPEHYKNACQLLWPHTDWHRWTELCNNEIRRPEAKVTVIMGAGSTGKTFNAGWEYLLEYYCAPHNTLVLISSTDLSSLEGRVWGEIKSLHQLAYERFRWLPGYLIDSKHCITTDRLEMDEYEEQSSTRDLRKGVMCFIEGTLVDTPSGKRPIQKIKPGDEVVNAFGVGVVKETFSRKAKQLVRIRISDGRTFDCTPEHPVLTRRGWIKAIDLTTLDMVLCVHETLSIMRRGHFNALSQQKVLQRGLPRAIGKISLRFLQSCFQAKKIKTESGGGKILQHGLCRTVGGGKGVEIEQQENGEVQEVRKADGGDSQQPGFLQQGVSRGFDGDAMRSMREKVCFNPSDIYKTSDAILFQTLQAEGDFSFQCAPSSHPNARRTGGLENVPGFNASFSFKNWIETIRWKAALVSARLGFSPHKTCGGNRWGRSPDSRKGCEGQTANQDSQFSRVDGVEILEPSSDKRFRRSEGGYSVHNLEVSGHPSYSINGVIVHNCIPTVQGNKNVGLGKWIGRKQTHMRLIADDVTAMSPTFLSAFANLNNNIDFQAIVLGNPNDILDPLGVAAEPKDGWTAHLEPTKTEVWDTQFYSGRCINLVGTDSPNFDFPSDQPAHYPYLVSQKKIDETVTAFRKDSYEYYSQCVGVMRISQMSRRIVTRDLCRQFHAQEQAVWSGKSQRVKIGALDAAYGGDRCVGGSAEFGECLDSKTRLQFVPPHIVPVKHKTGSPMEEEDQISEFEKDYCETNSVLPENFFHDSTGRGSLGTSLSRIWSPRCNPVEFGGSPTKRPVSLETFTVDKITGLQRLKRCDEHYSKFVSELHYSLRMAIEADQIRGLPDEVMNELCMREWDRVAGDKIEVESKIKMKERIRRSPDLADWAAIILEGARRKGFIISKLGGQPPKSTAPDWLDKKMKSDQELRKSKQLTYA